ncbi:hypothetical protein [Calorimonas adulescens]|uniref:Uncharacterized protein n=1 Tax=Calorimonas adulescens TaxID=2606906 RepID=A0A5D8QC77_9THEO|nr:hypothetical protein [Calorimonas adulescens]TZE81997.1 hypothetical protein FWJ32_07125 [Calorimonas adulescens]
MSFKDTVQSDLNVFFNLDEFAETRTIDGRALNVIVDNDRLQQRSQKEYDGISVGEILFYVKASEFGERPEQGTPMIFDGRQMYVFDCREDDGVYEIILQQNRGV